MTIKQPKFSSKAAKNQNMDSDESDKEYEVIFNVLINRRTRIYRLRKNFVPFLDEADFRCRFRMSKEAAWMVFELIRRNIKHKTIRNNALTPENMFLITLRYFATGCLQKCNGNTSGVSVSTTAPVVRTVFQLIALLLSRFAKFPSTVDGMRQLQTQFYQLANFPRVVAAIGCTHVKIISPEYANAELFRNRKGFFSFNVQTLCDSELNILDIVCRWPGSTHASTILQNSRIYSRFEANEFGNGIVAASRGYPCNQWIMTPLARVRTPAEKLYNESLIKTHKCIERSYSVWKRRFPVLFLGIKMKVKDISAIVVATAVLHNVCNLKNDRTAPPISEDIEALIYPEVSVPALRTSKKDNVYRRQIIIDRFENVLT